MKKEEEKKSFSGSLIKMVNAMKQTSNADSNEINDNEGPSCSGTFSKYFEMSTFLFTY